MSAATRIVARRMAREEGEAKEEEIKTPSLGREAKELFTRLVCLRAILRESSSDAHGSG